jgi:RND family efflux transporter MFP subunit
MFSPHTGINQSRSANANSNQYRRFLGGIISTVVVASGLAGCGKSETAAPTIRPALAYKITPGSGTDIDVYSGDIRARYEVDHAFRVGGKIARRLVEAGAVVKRGQPLAELDPQDAKLAADAARSQVTALQTEADFADAELKRYRDLFTKGFISQSALDQKNNVANAARARLDAQKATATVSLNQAGYATLVAQTDGVVTQVSAEAGQVVAQGQTVLRVANQNELELAIAIPESRIGDFRGANLKRPIRVHLWSKPEVFYAGKVREVSGAADATTRTYAGRIAVTVGKENKDSVGLGMSAFAAFVGSEEPGSFAVPLSALYAKGNNIGVWQIGADGKVTLKPVTVMQYRETNALVTSSQVKPGDTIVAAGVQKLRDGEVVKPLVDPQVKGDGKVAFVPNAAPNATPAGPGIPQLASAAEPITR